MAAQVDSRIDSIKALGGNSGEARLLLLASLLMADEIHDMRIEMDALRKAAGRAARRPASREGRCRDGQTARQAGRPRGTDCSDARASLSRWRAGLPGASGNSSPGPISISRELALSWSWSRYLVPTCSRGPWEDDTPTAMAAPHFASAELIAPSGAARAPAGAARGLRPGARRRAGRPCAARDAAAGRRGRRRLLADGQRDRHPPAAGGAARARPSASSLPETPPRGDPLIFRLWHPGARDAARSASAPRGRSARWCGRTGCWCRCWPSTAPATGWATAAAIYDRTLAGLPGAVADRLRLRLPGGGRRAGHGVRRPARAPWPPSAA